METLRKGIHIITWIILGVIGILFFVKWNSIHTSVVTHSGSGSITYGDKSMLVMMYIIAISVNVCFTLGVDLSFVISLKSMRMNNSFVEIVSILLQLLSLVVLCAFMLHAIF